MIFYLSDTHFGHYNIMRLSNRPFKTVEEMDKTIIKNWNSTVSENDTVYFLGDFSFKSGKTPEAYINKLNGHIHLITGNHDSKVVKNEKYRKLFESVQDVKTIKDGENTVVMCHYPMAEWDGYFRNTIHLYGHIHNNVGNRTYSIMKSIPNAYNVGADILGFAPRTLREIIELNKKFQSEN